MPQSLAKIMIHLIFCTNERIPFIHDGIKKELYHYLTALIREMDCIPDEINGTQDHVHVLFRLSRTHSIAKVVEHVKAVSSLWMKEQDVNLRNFSWQRGYAAFSVGISNFTSIKRYIQNQEEHHRTTTLESEYRFFLDKYQIPFDEKFLW